MHRSDLPTAAETRLPPPLRGGPWEEEIRTIEIQIARYRSGDLAEEKFRAFRLVHGIYGQRQPGVQMVRIKIPNGVLTARQCEALAEVAEHHGHGLAHVTTRQDVQFHHVPLEDAPAVLRRLARVGLMSREACGNSVRNVTCCPHSGIHREEPFAVLPYAQAVSRFLLRHPAAQLLGRKFKIALSGCPQDCAATAIHDIGLLARLKTSPAGLQRGFRLLAGGGLGPTPYLARTLLDFLAAHDVLRACEALVRLFSLHGNRKNRNMARSKFVVAKMGFESFQRRFAEIYGAVPGHREDLRIEAYLDPGELDLLREEWPPPAARPLPLDPPRPEKGAAPGFDLWLERNTLPQREPHLRAVIAALRLGDIEPFRLRRLAAAARTLGRDEVRTTIQQNFLLPHVPVERLMEMYRELRAAGLAEPIAGSAFDVTACPGSDTCNLGITSSKGLARAVAAELARAGYTPGDLDGISIKISGCPNSCGQHHIAGIGLHGAARAHDGGHVPYYQLHLGGQVLGTDSRIGRAGVKVPAKKAPAAVTRILGHYFRERRGAESLAGFLQRTGDDRIRAWLAPLLETPPRAEAADLYTDWERTEPFSTEPLGRGECAGAGVDLSADVFSEVVVGLEETRGYLQRGQTWDALAELNRAVMASGRILLHLGTGKEPLTDWETLCEFRARFVDRGHASELWNELRDEIDRRMSRKLVPVNPLPGLIDKAARLLEECRGILAALEVRRRDPRPDPLPGVFSHGSGEALG